MPHRYVLHLEHFKRGNMEIYNQLLLEKFGKQLKWSEVKELDENVVRNLAWELEDRIKLHKSPIDINKLARAIQYSRSGIGGAAMTEYQCKFCDEKEWWGSTAVPGICSKCAEKMATKIVMAGRSILKD